MRTFQLGSALLLAGLLAACGQGVDDGFETVWRVPLEPRFQTSDEQPAADEERLYAMAGGFVTFSAATGEVVWIHRLDRFVPRNVVRHGGQVFGVEAVAHALDARTGAELWRFTPETHGAFGFSAADAEALYFGTTTLDVGGRVRVYALDRHSGGVRWSRPVGEGWEHPATTTGVALSGDTLYAAGTRFHAENGYLSSGWIVALDRTSGEELWWYRNGEGTDRRNIISAPAVAGGVLLASDLWGGSFFAVDRFTGEEKWRVTGPSNRPGPSREPVVIGQTAYWVSNDFYVYAVEVETGAIRWRTSVNASAKSIAVCGDLLFVAGGGIFAVLDRVTGRTRHYSNHPTDFPTSDFASFEDRVYVLGNEAAYAYRCAGA